MLFEIPPRPFSFYHAKTPPLIPSTKLALARHDFYGSDLEERHRRQMARGNQREKAREKNLKDQAGACHKVDQAAGQKKKNSQSGTEFAKTKEEQAAIMRAKQAAAEAKRGETSTKK